MNTANIDNILKSLFNKKTLPSENYNISTNIVPQYNTNTSSITTVSSTSKTNIRDLLIHEGLPNNSIDKLYNNLNVFSTGFHSLISQVYNESSKPTEIVASLLKMYITLLEECQNLNNDIYINNNNENNSLYMMHIQKLEKLHNTQALKQEQIYYQQAELLHQDETRMKLDVMNLQNILENVNLTVRHGSSKEENLLKELQIQKSVLISLETNIKNLIEGLSHWKKKITDMNEDYHGKKNHHEQMILKLKDLNYECQKLQQQALKKKERIKELSDNETEDTNRYNILIQENKSCEKQITVVQDSIREVAQWNDNYVVLLTSEPVRNAALYALVVEATKLNKTAKSRYEASLMIAENSKNVIENLEQYMDIPQEQLQEINHVKNSYEEKTRMIYDKIAQTTDQFLKTLSLIQKKEIEIDDVKTAQEMLMNSLKRYAAKLEEQSTEIHNFKFNFPKIVHTTCNLLIEYRTIQRQLGLEKADLKSALQKEKILDSKLRHQMILFFRAQRNLSKLHSEFSRWSDNVSETLSNSLEDLASEEIKLINSLKHHEILVESYNSLENCVTELSDECARMREAILNAKENAFQNVAITKDVLEQRNKLESTQDKILTRHRALEIESKYDLNTTSKSVQAETDRLINSQSIMDQYVLKANENKTELNNQITYLSDTLNQISKVEADSISSLLSEASSNNNTGLGQDSETSAFVDQSSLLLQEKMVQSNRDFIAKCDADIAKFNKMTVNLKLRSDFLLKNSINIQTTTTKLKNQISEEDKNIHFFTDKLKRRLRTSNYHKELLSSALKRDNELNEEKIALENENNRLQDLIKGFNNSQNSTKPQKSQFMQTIPPQNNRDSQTNWLEVDNILNM